MRKRLAILAGITLPVIITAGISGHVSQSTTPSAAPLAQVTRHMPELLAVTRTAALDLDITKVRRSDAWREPNCDGIPVFLSTDRDVFWGWVAPDKKRLAQYLRGSDVLTVIRQQLAMETNGVIWEFDQNGPDGRPWYLVGTTVTSGQVFLRFKTENCGLREAELQVRNKAGRPGTTQTISFRQTLEPGYSSQRDSVPAVSRRREHTDAAYEAAERITGMTANYVGDAWVESTCNAVVVYQEANGGAAWTLVDARTQQVQENVTESQVRVVLQAALGDAFVAYRNPWNFEQDAPGARPRYRVGYMKNSMDNVWLHPNSESCTLRNMQVQLAVSSDSMGKFITLSIPAKPQ